LKRCSVAQYPAADDFAREITLLYEEREADRERIRLQAALSPYSGRSLSDFSLGHFRISSKYQDRPAAADIAFCVAAFGNGMPQDQVERDLENDYLSSDSSLTKRAAYIRRTIDKAGSWTQRGQPSVGE
jgi:hypothetical protein